MKKKKKEKNENYKIESKKIEGMNDASEGKLQNK